MVFFPFEYFYKNHKSGKSIGTFFTSYKSLFSTCEAIPVYRTGLESFQSPHHWLIGDLPQENISKQRILLVQSL